MKNKTTPYKILVLVFATFVSISVFAQTKLPFVGNKSFSDFGNNHDYEINISKSGNCIITVEYRTGGGGESAIETIYKGVYKKIIITKKGNFKIETSQVSFVNRKTGAPVNACIGVNGNGNEGPCVFLFSTGLLKE